MRFPIFLNYDQTQPPIGFVEIDDDVPREALVAGALVPALVKRQGEAVWTVKEFGFVPRHLVDTRKELSR